MKARTLKFGNSFFQIYNGKWNTLKNLKKFSNRKLRKLGLLYPLIFFFFVQNFKVLPFSIYILIYYPKVFFSLIGKPIFLIGQESSSPMFPSPRTQLCVMKLCISIYNNTMHQSFSFWLFLLFSYTLTLFLYHIY